MKLISCTIDNFGKLCNYKFNFNNNLNILKEENGFGKTTFACFLKAMFYGLESKKNTKALIERKKYEPWQGGNFGGSLIFELKEKKYKIERHFSKKEIDDTFKLYDLDTNLESTDFTSNIGEEIFKINREAYERSVFISGQNIETSMNDSINAKLGNILENENDINTSEKALKLLDETIKFYQKTGGRGEINEKINYKTKLERIIEESKIDEKNLEEIRKKNEDINTSILKLKEENNKLQNMMNFKIEEDTRNVKMNQYNMLNNELENLKKEIEEHELFFRNGEADENKLEIISNKCMRIEDYKIKAKNYELEDEQKLELTYLEQKFQTNEISEKIIDNNIENLNNLNNLDKEIEILEYKLKEAENRKDKLNSKIKKQKMYAIFCLIVAPIIAIISLVLFINGLKNAFAITCLMCLLFSITFSIESIAIKKNIKSHKEWQKNLKFIDSQLKETFQNKDEILEKENLFIIKFSDNELDEENAVTQLMDIKTNYLKYKQLKENSNILFYKKNNALNELSSLENEVKSFLILYFDVLEKPYMVYIQEIKIKKMELNKLKELYKEKQFYKENFEAENNIKNIKEIDCKEAELQNINKIEIENNIKMIYEEIDRLNDEKNYNKNQMELIECKLDGILDVENELNEINGQIAEMKQKLKLLIETKKYLGKAKDLFSSHYLEKMQKSFISNLNLLDKNQIEANIDINLDVKINQMRRNERNKLF